MGAVFISYRREGTAGEARALFNDLAARLGKESVFMDVDNIALGRDFRSILQESLASCGLMLVLIGRDWVGAKDDSGRLRLENSGDFVRLEIAAALKRNIPVTPVLVQGARMPAAEQLPEDIKELIYRNGFELSNNRWESDVQEMTRRLGLGASSPTAAELAKDKDVIGSRSEILGSSGGSVATAKPNSRRWLIIAVALVLALAGGGVLSYYLRQVNPTPIPSPNPSPDTVNVAKGKAVDDLQTQGIKHLLAKDLKAAISDYDKAYKVWPVFRYVDEIRQALRQADTPAGPDWPKLYKKIAKIAGYDRSGIPEDLRAQLAAAR